MDKNYDNLTKIRLTEELRSKGLKVSGSKDELIKRLRDNDEGKPVQTFGRQIMSPGRTATPKTAATAAVKPAILGVDVRPIHVPIDYKLVKDLFGLKFYNRLKHLGAENIIDPNAFVAQRGFYPDIGSIFLYGGGGSYEFRDKKLGNVSIVNGTIALNSTTPMNWSENGRIYYENYFDEGMLGLYD